MTAIHAKDDQNYLIKIVLVHRENQFGDDNLCDLNLQSKCRFEYFVLVFFSEKKDVYYNVFA